MFFAIYPSGYLLGKDSHTPQLSWRVPPGTRWPDITIRKLFDHHFSLCSKRPVTIKQDVYHARPLLGFMENRPVSSITQKEILAFCKSQKMSGMAQSTIHRRISLLRSVANFGKKEGYLSSAIEICSVSKGRARRTPPPTVSELNALLRVAAPHIHASSYLAFIRVPASARANSFP